MGATLNYEREKLVETNTTGMDIIAKAAEGTAATPIDLAGADGIIQIAFDADADESGGADVQDLIRVDDLQITISAEGLIKLTGSVIPVLGDGTDGTAVPISVQHPELMDAWQTAAGRARQV